MLAKAVVMKAERAAMRRSQASARPNPAPAATPFTFTTTRDKNFADVAAGLNLLWADGFELRLNYDGRFSDSSKSHAAGAKLGIKF